MLSVENGSSNGLFPGCAVVEKTAVMLHRSQKTMPRLYPIYSVLLFSFFSNKLLCTAIQSHSETGQDNEETICVCFCPIESPAIYKGGMDVWRKYLSDSTVYPDVAYGNGTEGLIRVEFTISEEGNVTEVTALNELKDSLTEAAVHVIQNSPKWKPAMHGGQPVKWRTVQHITFEMDDGDLPF